jgi:hypothetical protein
MSSYQLRAASVIRHVAFSKHDSGNHVLMMTHSGMVCAFKSHDDPRQAPTELYTFRQAVKMVYECFQSNYIYVYDVLRL